jgi:hypothetical protein
VHNRGPLLVEARAQPGPDGCSSTIGKPPRRLSPPSSLLGVDRRKLSRSRLHLDAFFRSLDTKQDKNKKASKSEAGF